MTKIVDGDSVWLWVDVGFRMSYQYNFRLSRIDSPELRDSNPEIKEAAYAAKARLAELIPVGTEVIIQTEKSGKYGRWLAEIFTKDGTSINDQMINEGHAELYQ